MDNCGNGRYFMSNFLAIDQGTTSSRAIVFNSQLNAITDSQQEYSLSYPNDGWVELIQPTY